MDETRKLFVGPRLKRLRRDRNLSQAGMAEELGISPSYLNLMERNQRPMPTRSIRANSPPTIMSALSPNSTRSSPIRSSAAPPCPGWK
jgi:DNA-binding XRE family transcriptional regulator